jgi:hypothetical protein
VAAQLEVHRLTILVSRAADYKHFDLQARTRQLRRSGDCVALMDVDDDRAEWYRREQSRLVSALSLVAGDIAVGLGAVDEA